MNGYLVTCDMIKNKTNFEALFVSCDLMASFYHPTLTIVKQPIEDYVKEDLENLL